MEAIMQWIKKICVRGALGLGAAALLLSGVPAYANPAASAASRESQPRLLAQSKAQPGKAEKLDPRCPEEQPKKGQEKPQIGQKKGEIQLEEKQQQSQPEMRKMRGAMPEAAPPKASKSRFGAGVIRQSEKPVESE
jgi:hypothetical protein